MNKYWFKQKTYGYGATPKTWEGWLTTLFLVLIVTGSTFFYGNYFIDTVSIWLYIVFLIIILSIIIIPLLKYKTKGEFKWRWGGKG